MLVSAVQGSESVHNPILSIIVSQPYVPYTIYAVCQAISAIFCIYVCCMCIYMCVCIYNTIYKYSAIICDICSQFFLTPISFKNYTE